MESSNPSDSRTTWKLTTGDNCEIRKDVNHFTQVSYPNVEVELFFTLLILLVLFGQSKKPKETKAKTKTTYPNDHRAPRTNIARQQVIIDWAKDTTRNNIITRHLQASCGDLRLFDLSTPLNTTHFAYRFRCYGCNDTVDRNHPVYVFSCVRCGCKFQTNRHMKRDLTGRIAIVIGGRTKLGHQVIIKLLDAGATVIATSRFPGEAVKLFASYSEWEKGWIDRLHFYPESFDLNTGNISGLSRELGTWMSASFSKIDIFIVCAAQTIRVREKRDVRENDIGEKNRYGDPLYVRPEHANSWDMRIGDFVQDEMEEVFRINATAPVLLFQELLPLLKKSERPFVINVHAREGLFSVAKHDKHLHTNMAKAGLAMFTKCVQRARLKTDGGKRISVHGCDPGWISIDEYHKGHRPWIVPPLDEIDGAARVLYPVMANLTKGSMKTRRHYDQLLY